LGRQQILLPRSDLLLASQNIVFGPMACLVVRQQFFDIRQSFLCDANAVLVCQQFVDYRSVDD
jgi:hypothetical protein